MPSDRHPTTPRGLHLDWVVVSVEGVRRWGLIALLALFALAGAGVAYYYLHEPIEKRAERVLRRASAAQEEVRRAGVSESLQGEYEQASQVLDEARTHWEQKDYPACLARAEEALRRFELMSSLINREFVGAGQIIALQGKVEVQRANQPQWERAKEKQPLNNGDFVKTASGASCEVLFADGTVYRIGPDSLLEMRRDARAAGGSSSGDVKVKVGQVNIYTAQNPSSLVTDAASAQVDRDSRVGVEVAEDSGTTVAAYAGRAAVSGAAGGRVDLSSLQAVTAGANGTLGERRAVPERPIPELPPVNALLNLDTGRRVVLQWRTSANALNYHIQVSKSRLFAPAGLDIDRSGLRENRAALNILKPGTYHWRVAAVGADKIRSEWSDARPFKAFSSNRVEMLADTTPPRLDVAKPTQMGNLIIVQGSTEPGVTVTVNGESVEVGSSGTFRKTLQLNKEGVNTIVIRATDPAGNVSEVTRQVFVEVD